MGIGAAPRLLEGNPQMRITRTVTAAGLAASLSLIATSALAVPIELFNTGVDSSGTVLADGASDPNYAILSPAQQAVVINESEIPGTWLDNDSTSRWIWQTNTGDPTNVTLTFRTTFDLTGLDPNTAEITGRWAERRLAIAPQLRADPKSPCTMRRGGLSEAVPWGTVLRVTVFNMGVGVATGSKG